MTKQQKWLSGLLVVTALTLFSISPQQAAAKPKTSKPVAAAKKVALPKPVLSGISALYNLGDALSVNLTSAGYTKNVKYKVVVTNTKTRKTYEVTKGYSKAVNPKKAANFKYALKTAGDYYVTAFAVGASEKTTNLSYAKKTFKVYNGVSVTKSKTKLSSRTINGDLYLGADNITVTNVKVKGTVIINPGKNGTTNLNNVVAANIRVQSGGVNSIHFNGVSADNLTVDSTSNVRIENTGDTQINSTTVETTYAIFDSQSGNFGTITVRKSGNDVPTVELRGTFTEPIVVESSAKIATDSTAQVPNVQIATNSNTDKVSLDGTFKSVEVTKEGNVEIADGAKITDSLKVSTQANITSGSNAAIENVEVAAANSTDKVTLDGTFKSVEVTKEVNVQVVDGAKITETLTVAAPANITSGANTSIANVDVATANSTDKVTLSGTFASVEVTKAGNLEVADGAKITGTLTVTAPASLTSGANTSIANVDVATTNSTDKVTLSGTFASVEVTKAGDIQVADGAKITGTLTVTAPANITSGTNATITNVDVATTNSTDKVTLSGTFASVQITKPGTLDIAAGSTVTNVKVDAKSDVNVATGSTVSTLVENAETNQTGEGTVGETTGTVVTLPIGGSGGGGGGTVTPPATTNYDNYAFNGRISNLITLVSAYNIISGSDFITFVNPFASTQNVQNPSIDLTIGSSYGSKTVMETLDSIRNRIVAKGTIGESGQDATNLATLKAYLTAATVNGTPLNTYIAAKLNGKPNTAALTGFFNDPKPSTYNTLVTALINDTDHSIADELSSVLITAFGSDITIPALTIDGLTLDKIVIVNSTETTVYSGAGDSISASELKTGFGINTPISSTQLSSFKNKSIKLTFTKSGVSFVYTINIK